MPSLVPRHPAMLPSATLREGLPRECADCPGTVTSRCRPRRERRWASPLVFPRRRRWAFIDFDASLLRNTGKPLSGKSVASREAQDGHQPRQVGGGLRGGLVPGACDAASAPSHRAAPESWARGLWGGRSGSGTAFSSDPCARDSRSGRLGSRGCKMGARRRPSWPSGRADSARSRTQSTRRGTSPRVLASRAPALTPRARPPRRGCCHRSSEPRADGGLLKVSLR